MILIGGGVGPLAGLHLHRLIIENTPGARRDQDHLGIIHASIPERIPDRTEALLKRTPEIPGKAMAGIIASLALSVQDQGQRIYAGIPCNTFHAPAIWKYFTAELESLSPEVEAVNMISVVLEYLKNNFGKDSRIGLLSTTGTRKTGIYDTALKAAGMYTVQPPESLQEEVHEAIYNPEWGLKATAQPSDIARTILTKHADSLVEAGADCIILGCTELPLLFKGESFRGIPLLDPMEKLALRLVFMECRSRQPASA